MSSPDTLDLSRTAVVLLAGGAGSALHELTAQESKAALPFVNRRLVDFPLAAIVAAGLPRLLVVLRHAPETLCRHLPETWGNRVRLQLHRDRQAEDCGTAKAVIRALESWDGPVPNEVLVLPADQVHALDLHALIAAHRSGDAAATLAEPSGGPRPGAPAPIVFGAEALKTKLLETTSAATDDLWADLLPRMAERGGVAAWRAPEGSYWRDVDSLDDFRQASLDFAQGLAGCPLPPGPEAGPLQDDRQEIAIETGGLTLTVPRFGARTPGRWTLLEDSVIMPGAKVASGARLSRAIVAPGAIVPAGLVVGDDPAEDARWFRVTPGGTTLVTPQMLSRRAAEQMRARIRDQLPGLVTPGHR